MVADIDLSILIVNWNSRDHLKRCLDSILAHGHETRFEIVVIDSGSYDGCAEMLREHYPSVRFIQSAVNLGFAKANNRAFEESSGESILFLNPDTEVVAPAIDTMYATLMSLPDAGVLGCKLLNADGSVQSSCVQSIPTIANQILNAEYLRRKWPKSSLWGMAPLYQPGPGPHEVEAASGACLMLRRKTFEEAGRFSEDYFMYVEDMDLAHKLRRLGYRNYYVPGAEVIHYGGGSSTQSVGTFAAVMMPEAIWRFLGKTRGGAYAFGYRLATLASALGRLAVLAVASLDARRSDARTASRRKWIAVFRWSVKRSPIVKQYYG